MNIEPHHYTLSELVRNKINTVYRIPILHTYNSDTTHDMGRGCNSTVWLRVPSEPNIGLVAIWNRFNRDTSPCERYDFIFSTVEEEA